MPSNVVERFLYWTRNGDYDPNNREQSDYPIAAYQNRTLDVTISFDSFRQKNVFTATTSGGGGTQIYRYTTPNTSYYANAVTDGVFIDGSAFDGKVTISGGGVGDYLVGGNVGDLLNGNNGNDKLFGRFGDDTLNGGDGDDTIDGGTGADTIDGGAGSDTVTYLTSGAGVTISLLGTAGVGGDAQGDVLTNVENLIGSNFDDTLIGSSVANILTGGDGNDILMGGAGGDTLSGGNGSDTLSYATSSAGVYVSLLAGTASGGDASGDTFGSIENLIGSASRDQLIGDNGNNILSGHGGGDLIDGGDGIDTVSYFDAATGVVVNLGFSPANGGAAAGDTIVNVENIVGSNFDDTLVGADDATTIVGGGGRDAIYGGGGIDTASYVTATARVEAYLAAPNSNVGDAAGDTYNSIENLTGSSFNDVLGGDASVNVIDGGAGNDIVSYLGATAGITASLANTALNTGNAAGDTWISIEALAGTSLDDTLYGDDNVNTLMGGDGDDLLIGGLGKDLLDGGAGNDTVSYADATSGIFAYFYNGNGSDSYVSIENIVGSSFDDALGGSEEVANNLYGGGGNDVFYITTTYTQNNGLQPSGGDLIDGGTGNDTVYYSLARGNITITLDGQTQSEYGDVFRNVENAYAGNGNDMLIGNAAANMLSGGEGNDTLIGGVGGDTLDGGNGSDTASYAAAAGAVVVNLAIVAANAGEAAGDVFTSIENVIGSAFADTLTGDGGNNILIGGSGDDLLDGAAGDDALLGGTGFDTIHGGAGVDTLTVDYSAIAGSGRASSIDVTSGALSGMLDASDGLNRTSFDGIEKVVFTAGQGADTLTVSNAALSLAGAQFDLQGGAGSDTLALDLTSRPGVTLDWSGGTLAGLSGVSGDGWENYRLTVASGGNTITTGGGDDSVVSTFVPVVNEDGSQTQSTNVFNAGAGNDSYTATWGISTFNGGDGIDSLSVDFTTSPDHDSSAVQRISASNGAWSGNMSSFATPAGVASQTNSIQFSGVEKLDLVNGGLKGSWDINLDPLLLPDRSIHVDGGDGLLFGMEKRDTLQLYFGSAQSGTLDTALSFHVEGTSAHFDGLAGTFDGFERYNLTGGNADDTMTATGSAGITFAGAGGNDTLSGNSVANNLNGGDGNDVLDGGAGDDYLFGGEGIDTASYASATSGVTVYTVSGYDYVQQDTGEGSDYLALIENLIGSGFDDSLSGDDGVNVLSGGSGDDVLIGGAGADLLDGGDGFDSVTYANAAAGVKLNMIDGTNNEGDALGDTLVSIERIVGSSYDDQLRIDAGVSVVDGGAGDDIITIAADVVLAAGGAGTGDRLAIAAGMPVTIGAGGISGFEAILVRDGASVDFSAFDAALPIVRSTSSAGLGAVITGTSFADTIIGGAGADTLSGGDDNDTITLKASPARVDGGAGSGDTLIIAQNALVALGDDQFAGIEKVLVRDGASIDFTDYSANLRLVRSTSTVGNGATIIGGSGKDVIAGGQGADHLSGGAGNDRLTIHNDTGVYDGGGDNDTVTISSVAHASLVFTDSNLIGFERATVAGGISVDFSGVHGPLYVTVAAGAASTTITGTAGDDHITGAGNADTISGGAGADYLFGSGGGDTFVFRSLAEMSNAAGATDRLMDFQAHGGAGHGDTIDLSMLDADPSTDGIDHFTFIGNAGFTGNAGVEEVRIRAGGVDVNGAGNYYVQFDTNHDKIADATFLVHSNGALTAADFSTGNELLQI